MIPELIEVVLKYDLDGTWVDSDCWADRFDYSKAARDKFFDLTGDSVLPVNPGDKDWDVFIEMQRDEFRKYVARYLDAMHQAKPGVQVTSNLMYSTFAPEPPTLALDYLSGDVSDVAALFQARFQARYLSRYVLPWDLMSWGFEFDGQFKAPSTKRAVQLQQEAAVIIAQGGAYQMYFIPTRAGWIDDRIVNTAAEVGKFCRQRQRWSHKSETLPEVGVIYSSRTIYKTGLNPFGDWGDARTRVKALSTCFSPWAIPLTWCPIGNSPCARKSTRSWSLPTGSTWATKLSTSSPTMSPREENSSCSEQTTPASSSALSNCISTAPSGSRSYQVADDHGFEQVRGNWITLIAQPDQIIANAYTSDDTRRDTVPLAVSMSLGKGSVILCPGPIGTAYQRSHEPILRSVVRDIVRRLHAPIVAFDTDNPALEVVLRTKNGQTLIHLINTDGSAISRDFHHTGIVRPTGPIHLRLRLPSPPAHVFLEPDGTPLVGKYEGGEWRGTLPDLQIHSILRIPGIVSSGAPVDLEANHHS